MFFITDYPNAVVSRIKTIKQWHVFNLNNVHSNYWNDIISTYWTPHV